MGRKSKYTIEQKVEAVKDYKSGKRGASQICNDLRLCKSGKALYRWVALYDEFGEIGFYPNEEIKHIQRS